MSLNFIICRRALISDGKAEFIKRCCDAVLAAMFLNDEITADEYFDEIKERDNGRKQNSKM